MTDDAVIQLDDDMTDAVEELIEARSTAKAAKVREKEARTKLLEVLHAKQASQGLTASGQGVKLSVQYRAGVDPKKLEALYPEVFEAVRTETSVEVLSTIV